MKTLLWSVAFLCVQGGFPPGASPRDEPQPERPAASPAGRTSRVAEVSLLDQDSRQVSLDSLPGDRGALLIFLSSALTRDAAASLKGVASVARAQRFPLAIVSSAPVEKNRALSGALRSSLKLDVILLSDPDGKAAQLQGIPARAAPGRESSVSLLLLARKGEVAWSDPALVLSSPLDQAALEAAVARHARKVAFSQPQISALEFGAITVQGKALEDDVILDRGGVTTRDKGPSRALKGQYGHTPLTPRENLPWKCKRLLIGTGMDGALPVVEELRAEAARRGVELILKTTAEAVEYLKQHAADAELNAVLHITC